MKKELGPMAKLHGGPDNKAIGGLNSTGPEAMFKISKNIPPKNDTIRVSKKYKPGDFVEEFELEKEIKKQTGAFPQLSVQDYSKVQLDDKGRNIVVKLNDGPQAIGDVKKYSTIDEAPKPPAYSAKKQKLKPASELNKFEKAKIFNKHAMETGLSPNFDSIRATDTTENKTMATDAMKKFYSNPANVRMMNKEKEKYFKNK